MSSTEIKIGSQPSPRITNGNYDVDVNVTSSTKDVFEGQVLIDRLLLYYSKFEGSRERAAHYAQKLLDLGHIECLTNGVKFEDSPHVYRWADASRVVNEVKGRAVEQQRHNHASELVKNSYGFKNQNGSGKAVLKISIETDNCEAAEIQASIKATPRTNGETHKKYHVEPKSVTTVEEDSFFGRRITKTLSYLSESKNKDEKRSATPYTTDVTAPPKDAKVLNSLTKKEDKTSSNESSSIQRISNEIHNHTQNGETKKSCSFETAEKNHNRVSSPRKKLLSPASAPLDTKQQLKNIAQGHKASLLMRKSATEPVLAKELSPGANGALENRCNAKEPSSQNYHVNGLLGRREANLMHCYDKELSTNSNQRPTEANNNISKEPLLIASTQTSEKSILEASKLYNSRSESKENGKRSPSPAPRRRTISTTDQNENKKSSDDESAFRENSSDAKSNELQRVSTERQQKKTRFCDEVLEASSSSDEKLGCSSFREQSDVNNIQQMSLHSTGNAEEMEGQEFQLHDDPKVPISPPPPSPAVRFAPTPSPPISPMKSLFWTKITKQEPRTKGRKIFWDEAIDELLINEQEFEKLFSKPPQSPQTPRMKLGDLSDNGKVLKVLGMERSRQVSIRASSVRLPVEDIHDAIVNMDDDKLDVDALQALCDIRPTPEELDLIADALKAKPNAILDKPEQFILMLAMIPSLDERLKCWIFAKRFPDKIVEVQEQLLSLNDVCLQIMQSTTLKKILEIILLLGNHMNRGSHRGEAYGFSLDILPKLKDVKSKKGETNLLEYVVKALREQMKLEGTLDEQVDLTPRGSDNCGLPNHELLHRSISVSLSEIRNELEHQTQEIRNCKEHFLPAVMKESTIPAESEIFQQKFEDFLEKATERLRVQAQLYQDVLLTIEDFQYYYMPNTEVSSKENLSSILRSLVDFSADFRRQWMAAQKEEIKEEFYKIRKYKKERQAEIQIKNTPSALKERFLSRRRPKSAESNQSIARTKLHKAAETNGHHHQHSHSREGTPIPHRNYKFEETSSRDALATPNGRIDNQPSDTVRHERASNDKRAAENSMRIEKRLQELQRQSSKN